MRSGITALLVMRREDRLPLMELLEGCEVAFLPACDCREAGELLARHPVEVVLTGVTLPDGDWHSILETVRRYRLAAEVIVCAPSATERLCAEVFASGAYDLIVPRCTRDELTHILNAAASRAYMRSLRAAPAAARRTAAAG